MVLLQPSVKGESQRHCGWNPVSRAAASTGLERRRPEPVAGVGPEIAPAADFGSARSGHGVVEDLLQRAALRHYVGEARHRRSDSAPSTPDGLSRCARSGRRERMMVLPGAAMEWWKASFSAQPCAIMSEKRGIDVPIQLRPRRTACRGAHDAAGLTGGADRRCFHIQQHCAIILCGSRYSHQAVI